MSFLASESSVSRFREPFDPQAASTPRPQKAGPSVDKGKRSAAGLEVPYATRRSYLVPDTELWTTRETLLKLGLEMVRPGTNHVRRTLSLIDEEDIVEELTLLDDALVGRFEGEDNALNEPVYSVDLIRYQRLMDLLEKRRNALNVKLEGLHIEQIHLPEWGPNGEPVSQWTAPLFAIFAVLFREDVENFLSYCLHPGEVPPRGTPYRESRREKAKRHDVAVAAAINLMKEDWPVEEGSIEETKEPEIAEPSLGVNRRTRETNEAPPRPRKALSPIQEDTESLDDDYDVRSLKENLAAGRTNQRRLTLEEELPYRQHSRSSRLQEVFEDPEFPESTFNNLNLDGQLYRGSRVVMGELDPVSLNPVPRARSSPGAARGRGGFGGRSQPTTHAAWSAPAPTTRISATSSLATTPHFDIKMKPELIEEWDGNEDLLVDWIESVNVLAQRSPVAYEQLGQLVPMRLKGRARNWWTSLTRSQRTQASTNWGSLKKEIARYFMTRRWLDRGRIKAQQCKFRDSSAPNESPSEYFIRKYKLLLTTEDYDDSLMIMSIMDGAPLQWQSVIDTSSLVTPAQLQQKIQYHEDALLGRTAETNVDLRSILRRVRDLEDRSRSSTPGIRRPAPYVARVRKVTVEDVPDEEEEVIQEAQTHLTGWSKELGKPAFPKDDLTVSKGRTPKDKGARACRQCGSLMHWDGDCKYARRNARQVRAHLATLADQEEYWTAMEEYEAAYEEVSDEEVAEPLNY